MTRQPPIPGRRRPDPQAGFTLVEVMVAMTLILVTSAAMLVLLQTIRSSTTASTGRQAATSEATTAAFRMTHDLRVATQAVVQSPQILDVVTWQRPAGGGALALAQVRYDCSSGSQCVRYRCAGAVISGNSCPAATNQGTVVRGLTNTDVFTPQSNGAAMATFPASTQGTYTTPGGLDYVAIRLAVRMDWKTSGAQTTAYARNSLEFRDGADLANFEN